MKQRLPAIEPTTATEEVKRALDGAGTHLGTSPNVVRAMANSPAALIGYLALETALTEATLDVRLRLQIALAVAEANDCQGCVAAHMRAGIALGLNAAAIQGARQATSSDPKVEAALQFARTVAEYRGDLTDDEFDRMRRAGYSHEEIAEIIANVVLSIYANYFNAIAQTEIDTPDD
ncbi:MAG: carboxymuconolactone decarboxylase family protein [Chloroflexota bacterium]